MWEEIQDMPGEIFDIEQAMSEEERFLELCYDLMAEGLVDEDAIEEEAHRLPDEENESDPSLSAQERNPGLK